MLQDIGHSIVTAWFGPKLPRLHATCIASWLANGYRAIVYSYRDKIQGLPSGAELRDASLIMPESKLFFLKNSEAYAHFSDIFRLELLKQECGIWCDADYLVLRPFPDIQNILLGKERRNLPCNAVMWMPAEHPILSGILSKFNTNPLGEWTYLKPRILSIVRKLSGQQFTLADLPPGHWGRHALKYYMKKLRIEGDLQPQDRFYAEESYTGELFRPGDFSRISDNPEVCGIHFFNKDSQHDEPVASSFYHWASTNFQAYR